jgi:hypothetical protein
MPVEPTALHAGAGPMTCARPLSISRVHPPDHATAWRVRVAVGATPAGGPARDWPISRGRPRGLGRRGGGGADTAAAPSPVRTKVR